MKVFKQKEFYGIKNDVNKIIFKANQIINKSDIFIVNGYFVIIQNELFFSNENDILISVTKGKQFLQNIWDVYKKTFNLRYSNGGGIVIKLIDNSNYKILFEYTGKLYRSESSGISLYDDEFIAYENNSELFYFNCLTEKIIDSIKIPKDIIGIASLKCIFSINYIPKVLLETHKEFEKMFVIKFADKINFVYNGKFLFDEQIEINEEFKYFSNFIATDATICPIWIKKGNLDAIYDLFSQKTLVDFTNIDYFVGRKLNNITFLVSKQSNKVKLYDNLFNEFQNGDYFETIVQYNIDGKFILEKSFLTKNKKTFFFDSFESLKQNTFFKTINADIQIILRKQKFFVCKTKNKDIIFLDLNFNEIKFGFEFNDLMIYLQEAQLFFLKDKKSKNLVVYKVENNILKLVENIKFEKDDSCYDQITQSSINELPKKVFLNKEQIKDIIKSGERIPEKFLQNCIEYQVYSKDEILDLTLEVRPQEKREYILYNSNFLKKWDEIFKNLTKENIKKYLTKENMFVLPDLNIWE